MGELSGTLVADSNHIGMQYISKPPTEEEEKFDGMITKSLSTLLTRPHSATGIDEARHELIGTASGIVGDYKNKISSGVNRPEDSTNAVEKNSEHLSDEVTNQVTKLYTELTHYQIAWKIVNKFHQDTGQLLRGN